MLENSGLKSQNILSFETRDHYARVFENIFNAFNFNEQKK